MLGLRTAQRAAFRAPANFAAKRYTSGIGAKGLQGPADNAFNRERSAVKDHAAATSGECEQTWKNGSSAVRQGRVLTRVCDRYLAQAIDLVCPYSTPDAACITNRSPPTAS